MARRGLLGRRATSEEVPPQRTAPITPGNRPSAALPARLGVGQASQRPVTAARGLLVQACWRRAQSSSCTWLAMPSQSPLARGGEAEPRPS
jgi:hypothetical protein